MTCFCPLPNAQKFACNEPSGVNSNLRRAHYDHPKVAIRSRTL